MELECFELESPVSGTWSPTRAGWCT